MPFCSWCVMLCTSDDTATGSTDEKGSRKGRKGTLETDGSSGVVARRPARIMLLMRPTWDGRVHYWMIYQAVHAHKKKPLRLFFPFVPTDENIRSLLFLFSCATFVHSRNQYSNYFTIYTVPYSHQDKTAVWEGVS